MALQGYYPPAIISIAFRVPPRLSRVPRLTRGKVTFCRSLNVSHSHHLASLRSGLIISVCQACQLHSFAQLFPHHIAGCSASRRSAELAEKWCPSNKSSRRMPPGCRASSQALYVSLTDRHTCAYIHACMHAYIRTHVHTYIHAYIQTQSYTHIHMCIYII